MKSDCYSYIDIWIRIKCFEIYVLLKKNSWKYHFSTFCHAHFAQKLTMLETKYLFWKQLGQSTFAISLIWGLYKIDNRIWDKNHT